MKQSEVLAAVLQPVLSLVHESTTDEYENIILPTIRLVGQVHGVGEWTMGGAPTNWISIHASCLPGPWLHRPSQSRRPWHCWKTCTLFSTKRHEKMYEPRSCLCSSMHLRVIRSRFRYVSPYQFDLNKIWNLQPAALSGHALSNIQCPPHHLPYTRLNFDRSNRSLKLINHFCCCHPAFLAHHSDYRVSPLHWSIVWVEGLDG